MQLPPGLALIDTADGSPTLAWSRDDGYVEKMHHAGGALSESIFIYESALDLLRRTGGAVSAMSIGLGLGYNELLTLRAVGTEPYALWSFEASDLLRREFAGWARGGDDGALGPTFDRIAKLIDSDVRSRAGAGLRDGRLSLRGPFPDDLAGVVNVNLVYFDAFSNKMDASLWDEGMLVDALDRSLAPTCVFATYAATGALNRVLRRLGFRRLEKSGFLGKRQSTLAVRGDIQC